MNKELLASIKQAVNWLWSNALAAKSYDYFLQTVENLIYSVYQGNLGGEFIEIMNNLIVGQISDAYERAWVDDGNELPPPEYLRDAAQESILRQQSFVNQFYKDIVDARVDQTNISALLARAPLWAQRWTEGYNEAIHLIILQNGGKEEWVLGATEQHCTTCASLNGIVAYASEWDQLNVYPQGAPNPKLECGGWKCDCSRRLTDKRRSPKAFESIMNIVMK